LALPFGDVTVSGDESAHEFAFDFATNGKAIGGSEWTFVNAVEPLTDADHIVVDAFLVFVATRSFGLEVQRFGAACHRCWVFHVLLLVEEEERVSLGYSSETEGDFSA